VRRESLEDVFDEIFCHILYNERVLHVLYKTRYYSDSTLILFFGNIKFGGTTFMDFIVMSDFQNFSSKYNFTVFTKVGQVHQTHLNVIFFLINFSSSVWTTTFMYTSRKVFEKKLAAKRTLVGIFES